MKRNKMNLNIYKTWGFYTSSEEEEITEEYKKEQPEASEMDVWEEAARLANEVYWYDFITEVESYDKQYPYSEYEVDIHFGTWCGSQEGTITRASLKEAIIAACDNLDDVEIYEDGYGKLMVDGAHHDSSDNHMEIFIKENGRRKNVHFRKRIYGSGY